MDWNKEQGVCFNYFEDAFESGSENEISKVKGYLVGYDRKENSFFIMRFLVATFQ